MRYRWILLIWILLGMNVVTTRADTDFIIDITAKTSMFGYSQGQDYEWTLRVKGDYDIGTVNSGTSFSWLNQFPSDGTFFESLTGEGISGTIIIPPEVGEYGRGVSVLSNGRIYLFGFDAEYGRTPDNTPIWAFTFGLASNIDFVISGATLPGVDAYLEDYNLTGTGTSLEAYLNGEDLFTLNSITISVPEPSTWALLFIAGAGCVALARRRAKTR